MLDRHAARRKALVGTDAGHRRDHADPGDIEVKLFGGDLGQRREDALAELDLARTHFHHAARQDAQPSPRRGLAASDGGSSGPLPGEVAISRRPGGRASWQRPRARRARSGSARRTGTSCGRARRVPRPRWGCRWRPAARRR